VDNYTEQLADGVWRIEVGPFINAFLVAADGRSDAEGLTLVDTGTKASGSKIVRSVRHLGMDPLRITDVVLTHWHVDHTGSARRFQDSSAKPRVLVGRADLAAVEGAVRHPQAIAAPGDVSTFGRFMGRYLTAGRPVVGSRPVDDGDIIEGCPRAVVVTSPGHTIGHISIHIPDVGVLLAGDAMWNLGGLTRGWGMSRSARTHEAATLAKLAALEFEILAPGHGPPVVTQAREKLRRLAQRAARRQAAGAA
jgi:glyoxylase-like metal-dependent hydrolase (beta-lactamase superfamily II)